MNTETFIAEILARPAIWKSGHPRHKFKHVVKRLWEEIKIKFPDSEAAWELSDLTTSSMFYRKHCSSKDSLSYSSGHTSVLEMYRAQ
ncbi:uncharacterized protein isoform X2 [Leptinotarsa decemlineata]|uniref:uncharacterized protein isoform X2 n=1 Tax=Leptinotarsa decemlineata TaxID=7539 RepID=UPI003D304882